MKKSACDGCSISKITWILVIVGALNWGLLGIFDFNLVAAIFGSEGLISAEIVERIIYTLVGISGLYMLYKTANQMKSMKK